MNLTASCRIWCAVTSLTSLLTHVFVQDRGESDCKLQNVVRSDFTPWLTHVFAQAAKPENLSCEFQMPSVKCGTTK